MKITTFFAEIWKKFEPEEEQALDAFEQKLTPDALKLMEDAVVTAAAEVSGGDAARDAAIAQFITDGKEAGIDVAKFAVSELKALEAFVFLTIQNKLPAASAAQATTETINGAGAAV